LTNQFTVGGRTVESFIHSGNPVRVMNKALSSNVATITTDIAHGLEVGNSVFVSGVDATFDGTYTIKTKTATTFTYDRVAANVASTALTTAGSAQKSNSLAIGQTYYYQAAFIYTDNTQTCTTACLSAFSSPVSAQTQFSKSSEYSFTGGVQSYIVPAGVTTLSVDAIGADGGVTTFAAGIGGRVEAVIPVTPGEVLFVFVGGGNSASTGGWNGGGSGSNPGLGGGGATDIRRGISITNAALTTNVVTLTTSTVHGLTAGNSIVVAGLGTPFDGTYSIVAAPSTTTFTYSKTSANVASAAVNGAVIQALPASSWARRVLVAGGGGGAGSHSRGGNGGGLVAAAGVNYGGNAGGVGGTQSTGSALGVGAAGTTNAGGGGGDYLGGGGGAAYAGGGGGSSFV
jgi:hypothetical protein